MEGLSGHCCGLPGQSTTCHMKLWPSLMCSRTETYEQMAFSSLRHVELAMI